MCTKSGKKRYHTQETSQIILTKQVLFKDKNSKVNYQVTVTLKLPVSKSVQAGLQSCNLCLAPLTTPDPADTTVCAYPQRPRQGCAGRMLLL